MKPLSWEAREYLHIPKTSDWFWAVGIVAASAAFISVLLGNVLFAIFIVLAAFSLSLYAARPPKSFIAEIQPKGIKVNQTIFPYSEIQSFAIATDIRHPALVLTMKKILMPHVLVPLGDVDVEEVRALLSKRLSEDHYEEPVSQKIFDALGF